MRPARRGLRKTRNKTPYSAQHLRPRFMRGLFCVARSLPFPPASVGTLGDTWRERGNRTSNQVGCRQSLKEEVSGGAVAIQQAMDMDVTMTANAVAATGHYGSVTNVFTAKRLAALPG